MITSGYYNSVGGDRKYTAEQFNDYFEGLVSGGVFEHVDDGLFVKAGSGMQVQVGTGKLMDSKGRWMRNDAIINLDIPAADVTLDRYDAVIVKIDNTSSVRGASVYIKQGAAASNPIKSGVTRTYDVEEYCLAYVRVNKGVESISQSNITDNRFNTETCGIVTGIIEQINTSELFLQFTAAWEEWFAHVRNNLTESSNLKAYRSKYVANQDNTKIIPINISQYVRETDILNLYVSGLKLREDEYTFSSDSVVSLVNGIDKNTVVTVEVLKNTW